MWRHIDRDAGAVLGLTMIPGMTLPIHGNTAVRVTEHSSMADMPAR
ncbi:MAG: hypothetical protein U1F35_08960 [Steroidobacteraceae bacterium]